MGNIHQLLTMKTFTCRTVVSAYDKKKRHSANISYSVQKNMEELDNERTHLRYLIYRTHSFKMKGSDLTQKGMGGQVISLSSSHSPSK